MSSLCNLHQHFHQLRCAVEKCGQELDRETYLAVLDLTSLVLGVRALRACMLEVKVSTSRFSLVGVSEDKLKERKITKQVSGQCFRLNNKFRFSLEICNIIRTR